MTEKDGRRQLSGVHDRTIENTNAVSSFRAALATLVSEEQIAFMNREISNGNMTFRFFLTKEQEKKISDVLLVPYTKYQDAYEKAILNTFCPGPKGWSFHRAVMPGQRGEGEEAENPCQEKYMTDEERAAIFVAFHVDDPILSHMSHSLTLWSNWDAIYSWLRDASPRADSLSRFAFNTDNPRRYTTDDFMNEMIERLYRLYERYDPYNKPARFNSFVYEHMRVFAKSLFYPSDEIARRASDRKMIMDLRGQLAMQRGVQVTEVTINDIIEGYRQRYSRTITAEKLASVLNDHDIQVLVSLDAPIGDEDGTTFAEAISVETDSIVGQGMSISEDLVNPESAYIRKEAEEDFREKIYRSLRNIGNDTRIAGDALMELIDSADDILYDTTVAVNRDEIERLKRRRKNLVGDPEDQVLQSYPEPDDEGAIAAFCFRSGSQLEVNRQERITKEWRNALLGHLKDYFIRVGKMTSSESARTVELIKSALLDQRPGKYRRSDLDMLDELESGEDLLQIAEDLDMEDNRFIFN